MANLLNDYRQAIITREDYVDLLRAYALTQYDPDGRPMVREDHHPDEPRWLAMGDDYNHSRYCDLIITEALAKPPSSVLQAPYSENRIQD
jgi:hypothetical protein